MSELLFDSKYLLSDEVELTFSTPGSDWPITISRGDIEHVKLTPREANNLMKALIHLTGFQPSSQSETK